MNFVAIIIAHFEQIEKKRFSVCVVQFSDEVSKDIAKFMCTMLK